MFSSIWISDESVFLNSGCGSLICLHTPGGFNPSAKGFSLFTETYEQTEAQTNYSL